MLWTFDLKGNTTHTAKLYGHNWAIGLFSYPRQKKKKTKPDTPTNNSQLLTHRLLLIMYVSEKTCLWINWKMSITPIWILIVDQHCPLSPPITMYIHIFIIFWLRKYTYSTNLLSTKSICQSPTFPRGRETKSYEESSLEWENIQPIKKQHGNYGTLLYLK